MPTPTKAELAAIEKKRLKIWDEWRADFKLHQLQFVYDGCKNPGTFSIEAYHPGHPAPVGIVWWRYGVGDDVIDIMNSYTFPDCQRLGIRTALQDALIEWVKPKFIITGNESTPFGIAWMLKYGYRLLKDGTWRYTVPSRRRT